MKIIDAYILARTKRKTRRIRMALVVFVSALMFSVLIFGSFVATGLQKSASQFKDVGYNSRFLASAYSVGYTDYSQFDTEIKAQMDSELRARGVKVDDALRNGSEYMMEFTTRAAQASAKADQERQAALEQKIATNFKPRTFYHLETIESLQGVGLRSEKDPDPFLTSALKPSAEQRPKGFFGQEGPMFLGVEQDMLTPVVASGQSLDWQPGQAYPVLVPYAYLATLADKSVVNVSSEEKINTYRQLIGEYTGKELTYCYRNPTAQEQLSAVLAYNKQAEIDKDRTTNPLPVTPCQGFDQAQLKKLGIIQSSTAGSVKPLFPRPVTPPLTRDVKLKIAGFVPTPDMTSNNIFASMFSSINNWPSTMPVILPAEVVAQDPFLRTKSDAGFAMHYLFVDFANRADQKAFVASGCSGEECMKSDSLFITAFGNIKVALEGTIEGGIKVMKWVVLGISVIAGLMLMMTISKVIADSRREIAVFRALGARRRDIAQIYFTYGFMLAGSSLVVAIVLAVIGALIFSAKFSGGLNTLMVEATGAFTLQTNTVLLGVNWLWLAAIAGVLFLASFIGILIPVLLSNRKNLMNIMRDE